ncbi:MAG TPA: hypothetical protein VGB34_05470, partial [Candidatus Limnocylindria bacterium]
ELAVGRYEIDDGLTLLRQAVALEPDPTRQAALWFEIGHASALKYDGEGFVAALQTALELGAPEAQVYPELAFQTAQRAGMWQRRLDDSLVEGWIERAVAVAPEGTPYRIRALVAKAYWQDDLAAAHAALAIADGLDVVEFRSMGLGAVQSALQETGQFVEAGQVASERAALLPAIADPDHVADALFMTADLYANVGRLADARVVTARLEETVAGLTPHHRVHGLGMRMRLEAAVADWETGRALTQRVEDAVEANLATPCPFNVGLLLLAALSMVYTSDDAGGARLVAKAESIGMVGYGRITVARWLRLAIAHHDLDDLRRRVDSVEPAWLIPGAWELWAAFLDSLALLGERDRIEAEAPQWVRPDAYVAPFAVRALGVVRNDTALLTDAIARFETRGLEWHAQETRSLLDPS